MKDKINKIFHTDKWWGKTIFIILTYALFWFIFYGSWFLIPQEFFNNDNNLNVVLFLFYIFIIVPILSFYIPKFIKKLFLINKIILYSLHIFLIILSLSIFMGISI